MKSTTYARAEGIAEGAYNAKVDIAITFLKSGFSVAHVAVTTRLSESEVSQLNADIVK